MHYRITIIAIGLFLLCFPIKAQNEVQELKAKRDSLINAYETIISTPRQGPETVRNIFNLQHDIINLDSIIIVDHLYNALGKRDSALVKYNAAQKSLLNKDFALEEKETENLLLLSSAITLSIVAFILLFLLVVNIIRRRKTARELRKAYALIKAYKNKISDTFSNEPITKDQNKKIIDLEYIIKEQEKKAGETHIQILKLKNENEKLIKQLSSSHNKEIKDTQSEKENSSKANPSIEEVNILEHQLIQSRAELYDLTDSNNTLSQELQKYLLKEEELSQEIEQLKTKLSDNYNDADIDTQAVNEQISEYQKTIEVMTKQNEIYEDRLLKEQQIRENFEKEIYEILESYKSQTTNR